MVGLLLLIGCQLQVPPTIIPTPIMLPAVETAVLPATHTPPATITPLPTATTPPDSGWQSLQTGLAQRTIRLMNAGGEQIEQLLLLRIDPAHFQLQVGYRPGAPQSLAAWQQETGALLVVNGGFFTETYEATAHIVVDGAGSGTPYEGFGGMVAITETAVSIRALAERPFAPDEPLLYALQSFPVLLRQSGQITYDDPGGGKARRTVIGQDENGRIVLILAPWGSFSLYEMAQYLRASDLNLQIALNLDGGSSTGLLLVEPPLQIPAFTLLPMVLLIVPKMNE